MRPLEVPNDCKTLVLNGTEFNLAFVHPVGAPDGLEVTVIMVRPNLLMAIERERVLTDPELKVVNRPFYGDLIRVSHGKWSLASVPLAEYLTKLDKQVAAIRAGQSGGAFLSPPEGCLALAQELAAIPLSAIPPRSPDAC